MTQPGIGRSRASFSIWVRLNSTAPVPDNLAQQKHIIFDPIPRVDGIEASGDPLLELRAAIYLLQRQAPSCCSNGRFSLRIRRHRRRKICFAPPVRKWYRQRHLERKTSQETHPLRGQLTVFSFAGCI